MENCGFVGLHDTHMYRTLIGNHVLSYTKTPLSKKLYRPATADEVRILSAFSDYTVVCDENGVYNFSLDKILDTEGFIAYCNETILRSDKIDTLLAQG
jgi:hypothetical protein